MHNNKFIRAVVLTVMGASMVYGCSGRFTSEEVERQYAYDRMPVSEAPGLSERPSNTQCLATRFQQPASIRLEPMLPEGALQAPVNMTPLPGSDDVFYVLEQGGRIWRLQRRGDGFEMQEWVDLSAHFPIMFLRNGCHECGLFSLTFHPEFEKNGYIYLSYTEGGDGEIPLVSHVARVRSEDGGRTLVTEEDGRPWRESLYQVPQPDDVHNGGQLRFGPDGYLYLTLGDGGPIGDPKENSQNTDNPYGSMLRLTDEGEPAPGNKAGGLPEVYAYGLRNAWGWSFDRKTGTLWAGDVGGGRIEEIDIIENGGNYGWPCMEGREPTGKCDVEGDVVEPIWDYTRAHGRSITGGYVYRGEAMPELYGTYFFSDFGSGGIWGLEQDGDDYHQRLLLHTGSVIVAFAEDYRGELYLVDYEKGSVYRVLPAQPHPDRQQIPERLSETGCMDPEDPSRPSDALIPYDVREPFWSDGARKERYMALPEKATVSVSEEGDLIFPVGSVLVKQFHLKDQLVETRLLLNQEQTGWIGYSYQWNKEQTEAHRLETSADVDWDGQLWHYPSSAECAQCHTPAAGHALGPEIRQLDRPFHYTGSGLWANQLDTLASLEVFDRPLPGSLREPTMPASRDERASLEQRARAYLHSNCANCHRPKGISQSNMDWRYDTPMALTESCDKPPKRGDLGIAEARLIAPGEPERSILWQRMAHQDAHRMPPLGSHRIDQEGADLVAEWIRSLEGCYTLAGPMNASFTIQNVGTEAYLDRHRRLAQLTDGEPQHWRVEEGNVDYRIQALGTRRWYLHAEQEKLQVGTIRPGWWSAEWELQPRGDAFLIRNRWLDDHFLYINQGDGRLMLGPVNPHQANAQWRFETVER